MSSSGRQEARRDFLKGMGGLAAGLATAATGATALQWPAVAKAIEPIDRTKKPLFRLSLAAYSFRGHLQASPGEKGAMSLDGFVDYCASMNLEGAELTSYYFPPNFDNTYVQNLKRRMIVNGMSVSGGAVRNDFCTTNKEKLQKDIDSVKKWIDVYASMGCPTIRVFAGSIPKGDTASAAISRCQDVLGKVCEYAGEKGVFLGLENHWGITENPDDLIKIVQGVRSPWLGINLDTGNFKLKDPYEGIRKLAPYAVSVQYKVMEPKFGDEFPVATDLSRIVGILEQANYRGWVALEYEAKENPDDAVPKYLYKLRDALRVVSA